MRASWWVRALAALPLRALHVLASVFAWFACGPAPYRPKVVRHNLTLAFPDFDPDSIKRLMCRFYAAYADVMFEIVKGARLSPHDLRQRVVFLNMPLAREWLARGKPVLLMAGHQCNWEWLLLALSDALGYPLDAAYKPLVNPWADREMRALRARLGAHLVPAQDLLASVIQRRQIVRAIALVADQEPVASERRHWTRFLNRDSAFFVGAEEIVRKTRYPALFVGMRRLGRGRYEAYFEPLCESGEQLAPGELTERYARRVERQIRDAPADWTWSHKRWKLRKSVYDS